MPGCRGLCESCTASSGRASTGVSSGRTASGVWAARQAIAPVTSAHSPMPCVHLRGHGGAQRARRCRGPEDNHWLHDGDTTHHVCGGARGRLCERIIP